MRNLPERQPLDWPRDQPWSRLQAIVDFEIELGNRPKGSFREQRDGWRWCVMREVLHLEEIRAEFALPPEVELSIDGGSVEVIDGLELARIWSLDMSRPFHHPQGMEAGRFARWVNRRLGLPEDT